MGLRMHDTPPTPAYPGLDPGVAWTALAQGLRGLALGLTRDPHAADDLVQQTIAALIAKRPDRADHVGYARATLTRLWLDDQRSLRRTVARLARRAHLETVARLGRADEGDHAELHRAMDALPPRQRAALVMRILGDMDYPEIAAALECTVEAVRASLHLARARLRHTLGEPA